MSAVTRSLTGIVAGVALAASTAPVVLAADQWIEVKSAHFTAISNAGERTTRRLVWQFEQVRSATSALFSWAKTDLNRPLTIIIVKDENSMRALAPKYWEEGRSVRPASVWVGGPDATYIALRGDVEVETQGTLNPYMTAYWSYIDMVFGQGVGRNLPLWFRRGFTEVLSNTIVLDDKVLIGAPIPWEIQRLRDRPLLLLPKLLTITSQSPEVTEATRREVFDAETWAFVHFLMFGDEGARSPKLAAYANLVAAGKDPAASFAETLGPVEPLDTAFRLYYKRDIFSYRQLNIDVGVKREPFPVRPLPPAESASVRAMFHAAMHRPVESRAAIAEARKADPNAAGSYVAEGLLADQDDKAAEAKAAYAKSAELNATSAYAYYRLASLTWQPNASRETYVEIEQHLAKAIDLNIRYAAAYAWLGETRAILGTGDPVPLIRRAISLEPMEARHRLRLAGVLLRRDNLAEARIEAEAALRLADTDDERRDAERMLESATRVTAPAASPPAPAAAASASSSTPAMDLNGLNKACQSGDNAACGRLLPTVEAECARKNGSACGFAGFLYERGRGVAVNAAMAASLYNQSCDAGDKMGCVGFALLQASGKGVIQDEAKARASLSQLCQEDVLEACMQLAVLIVPGGKPADIAHARELLTKACDGKHERACALLKSMPMMRPK
jgi:TPR repeat protein